MTDESAIPVRVRVNIEVDLDVVDATVAEETAIKLVRESLSVRLLAA